MLWLPIEIWIIIFKFLDLKDLFMFKFLSRKSNSIYFSVGREKNLFFLIEASKKVFNVNNYHFNFNSILLKEFILDLKRRFTFSKYLYLRSSLEEISREITISNIFLHLFYCPRSSFAKSECICARLFLKKEVEVNAEYLENLNILPHLDIDENEIEMHAFEFNFFWNNEQQRSVINSNVKRCLSTFIVQYNKQFLLLFLEIQIRIFMNFFVKLSKSFSKEKDERELFLKMSLYFVRKFSIYVMNSMKFSELEKLFDEIEFAQFKFLKVINNKYKEELIKKYED